MKITEIIKKAIIKHGDIYDYSLSIFINYRTKIKIICKLHGIFEQLIGTHLQGKGCPKCVGKNRTVDELIVLMNLNNDNKYTYDGLNTTRVCDRININCKEHGIFIKEIREHLKGKGCPKCSNKSKYDNTSTQDIFIDRANKKHNNFYNYTNTIYINLKTKIKINCPIHGEFEQRPCVHLLSDGCPKCSLIKKTLNNGMSYEELFEKVNKVHNNKYEYPFITNVKIIDKIKIKCSLHGEFYQRVDVHLKGSGCVECFKLKNKKTLSQFKINADITHNNEFDYSLSNYINAQTKLKVICRKHGIFEQTPNNHLSKKQGCPKCALKYDKTENEIKEFIKSFNINIIENDRKILNGKELDILIPSHNIGVEFDGLYWHSELYKPNDYHLDKTNECEKQNIQLIHIFEDEWLNKKEIVKSRLLNILGLTSFKIYGRKTEIREVSSKDSKLFLDENHIQGNVNSKIKLGLYYNDELVSLMTFSGLRKSMGSKSEEGSYELLRFCNKLNTSVIGGADKLLKYFIHSYKPKEITSYADRRWSQGNLYEKLNFEFIHDSKPNYFYIKQLVRENRFKYRKDILIKDSFDPNKTEKQIMFDRGFYRIYDCGTKKYHLKIKNQ